LVIINTGTTCTVTLDWHFEVFVENASDADFADEWVVG
jgi:hypothetical protein